MTEEDYSPTPGYYFTDCIFVELNDEPNQPAPIRKVKLLDFDGDKLCKVEVEGIIAEVKYFYLYADLYEYNHSLSPITREQIMCDLYEDDEWRTH